MRGGTAWVGGWQWLRRPPTHFVLRWTGWLPAFAEMTVLFILIALTCPAAAQTPATPSPDSVFSFPERATDWSLGIINYLFRPDAPPTRGLENFKNTQLQVALATALGFYSKVMLVIAAFMLLYHLIAIVGETAQTGRPFGRANQIWAPIRLVVAIGLLVPIGTGLNSGQYLVVKLAEWGSGLASQTWKVFLNTLGNQTFALRPVPPPDIRAVVENALMMRTCEIAYNAQLTSLAALPPATRSRYEMKMVQPTGVGIEGFSIGNEYYDTRSACGRVVFADPAPNRAGQSQVVGDRIAAAHVTVFRNQLWSRLEPAAQTLANNPESFTDQNFRELVDFYQTELSARVLALQTGENARATDKSRRVIRHR